MARIWVFVLAGLWLTAVVISAVMFQTTEATDFGLTAGLNRIGVFLGWQLAALVLALLAGLATIRVPKPRALSTLLTGLTPIAVSGTMGAILVAVLIWANASRPAPGTAAGAGETPAVTAPAEPLVY
jgi:hypothetical protein